jgi:membrane protease YdiL (CAAX protease family)
MDIFSLEFLTIIIFVFALVMMVTGIFSAYFGAGKNRAYGAALLVVGLVVAIIWGWLVGFSDIEPYCDVAAWDTMYNAIIDTVAVLIGALVAVGIFLVVVLKS